MSIRFGALKVTTPPAQEPVTVGQAKAQLRITHTKDDVYLAGLISVAREWAEDYTRRAFITQQLVAQYVNWPLQFTKNAAEVDAAFIIPRPPLASVQSVNYYDNLDAAQTLATSQYRVDAIQDPGTVMLKQINYPNSYGPTLSQNYVNPITIAFTCGYGDSAAAVPARIKQAILIMVAHLYTRRTPVEIDMRIVQVEVPFSAAELLDPLKLRLV